MRRFRILLGGQDGATINHLGAELASRGYEVLVARNSGQLLEQAIAQQPDMVLLDLALPTANVYDVLRDLRSFSSLPAIVLTAGGSDEEKIKALTLGADDCLGKPFTTDELVARMEAVRRRALRGKADDLMESLSFGDLSIDLPGHRVVVGGEEKPLTRIEWLLLSELVRHAGRLITYEGLLTTVWGPEYRDDIQLLRTWISRLRYKLANEQNNPRLIRTVPKAGYIVDLPQSYL